MPKPTYKEFLKELKKTKPQQELILEFIKLNENNPEIFTTVNLSMYKSDNSNPDSSSNADCSSDSDSDYSPDDHEMIPLFIAEKNNHVFAIKALLEIKGIDINIGDEYEGTPLTNAFRNEHYEIAMHLLANTDLEKIPMGVWYTVKGEEYNLTGRFLLQAMVTEQYNKVKNHYDELKSSPIAHEAIQASPSNSASSSNCPSLVESLIQQQTREGLLHAASQESVSEIQNEDGLGNELKS